jgi:hypothetical protein
LGGFEGGYPLLRLLDLMEAGLFDTRSVFRLTPALPLE